MRAMVMGFAVLVVTVLGGPVWSQVAEVAVTAGRITVQGVGQVDAAPDMATIQAGVTAQGDTAAEALNQTSAATANVLETLAEAGIEPRDVQTRGLSLNPLWTSRKASGAPEIAGYEARNTVMVRVRALDRLGVLLDAVVESGANQFHGLTFGVRNPKPLQDEARALAVKDALDRAALYAEAAGVALGDIVEISELGGGGGPRPMAIERMAVADSVPIAAGELTLSASVTVVFEIARE